MILVFFVSVCVCFWSSEMCKADVKHSLIKKFILFINNKLKNFVSLIKITILIVCRRYKKKKKRSTLYFYYKIWSYPFLHGVFHCNESFWKSIYPHLMDITIERWANNRKITLPVRFHHRFSNYLFLSCVKDQRASFENGTSRLMSDGIITKWWQCEMFLNISLSNALRTN